MSISDVKLELTDTFETWKNKFNKTINDINEAIENIPSTDTVAPTNHASEETIYGIGNDNKYGHVKLSDSIDNDLNTANGVAATPLAVKKINDILLLAKQLGQIGSAAIINDDNIDVNSFLEPGCWWISKLNNAHNLPENAGEGFLQVYNESTNYSVQKYICLFNESDITVFFRLISRINLYYYEWKRLISDKELYNSQINTTIPIGGIISFSGTFGGSSNRYPIPLGASIADTHWCLCDGIETNGYQIPDLRGRMILGANDKYIIGSNGGSINHQHRVDGNVDNTTLTVEQLPGHTHWASTRYINSSQTVNQNQLMLNNYLSNCSNFGTGFQDMFNSGIQYTGNWQPHSHTFNTYSYDASSLPPYYVLSYIIRVA